MESSATDLLVYGTDEILKGTDMGTLAAFAALAFQQIRGKVEPHHGLGCSILLVSVVCASSFTSPSGTPTSGGPS
jgi:hypothetical protein